MAKVPNGVETLPKISIVWVRCTNVTDDRQTTDDRRTDDDIYSEHEHEFTFAKMETQLQLTSCNYLRNCRIPAPSLRTCGQRKNNWRIERGREKVLPRFLDNCKTQCLPLPLAFLSNASHNVHYFCFTGSSTAIILHASSCAYSLSTRPTLPAHSTTTMHQRPRHWTLHMHIPMYFTCIPRLFERR